MSTVNPDERSRRIAALLRPGIFVGAILVQFIAPVSVLLWAVGVFEPDPGIIMVYVFVWVVFGVGAMIAGSTRSPYVIGAFSLAYIGGLFAVIAISTPNQGFGAFNLVAIFGTYIAAAIMMVLWAMRGSAMRRTREIGVDTTATVISAAVTGMVNYVTRQRLTLKFTDQQGVERFLRVGRTGGGWKQGDTIPIRYDPTRPGYRRGILVNGEGPSLF